MTLARLILNSGCGVGLGGFQPGNRCAGGGSGGKAAHSGHVALKGEAATGPPVGTVAVSESKAVKILSGLGVGIKTGLLGGNKIADVDKAVDVLKKHGFTHVGHVDQADGSRGEVLRHADGRHVNLSRKNKFSNTGGLGSYYARPTNNTEGSPMTKAEKVTWLTENSDCWEAADATVLNTFADEKLDAFVAEASVVNQVIPLTDAVAEITGNADLTLNEMPAALKAAVAKKKGAKSDPDDDKEPPVKNATATVTPKPMTDDEWWAQAPAGVKSVVNNGLKLEKAAKVSIIGRLTANMTGPAKAAAEKVYGKMELEELEAVAPPARTDNYNSADPFAGGSFHAQRMDLNLNADYSGQGAGGAVDKATATGTNNGKATPGLDLPSYDFAAIAAGK